VPGKARADPPHGCRTAKLTFCAIEKRPSTDGLVDNIDPRGSHELDELDELPKYEVPTEAVAIPLKEQLITCFWVALNTLSTLGLIFLSKRYAYTERSDCRQGQDTDKRAEYSAMNNSAHAS
jgi:hypothetical protein